MGSGDIDKERFDLQQRGDAMLAKMQTPEAVAGIRRAFDATPTEFDDIIKDRLREMVFDGTLKAAIDEAVGDDPDLALP